MNLPTNEERCKALLKKHGLDENNPAMMAAIKEAFIAGLNADCMVLKKSEVKEND